MQSLQRGVKCAAVLMFAAFTMSVSACSDIAGPSPEQIDPANAPRLAVSPQLPGLVAAYGFDEASGATVADGSGNSNTGILGTGVTRTTAGKFGGALTFNRGYVSIPDAASLDLTTGLTLEAWVYPTATPTTWATVVLKEQPGEYVYTLYNSGPSNPSGEINVSTVQSGERIAMGPSPTPLNTWTHLTSTYDGAAVRLYVNGALVATKAATGPVTASAGVLRIGGNAVWGEYFTGRIDEVRIYNRALSVGEIQTDITTPINAAPVADAIAPTVSITTPTPTSPYATTATTITLGGTASDNVGVTQVSWANDRGGAGTATGTTSWTASGIALQPGTNIITVSARDAANNVSSATLTVTTPGTSAGLVAAYGFDEASGATVADGSGNSNTGTLGTGVTRTTAGKFGGALTFNRGYVSIPDAASLDLTTGLTLEAWVYPTATPTTWATVVLKEQPGDYVYTLYNSGPSNPSGEINVGTATSGERIALGPSPVPLNTWTHLASTYDGSAVRLYVNGALVGIKAATGPVTASGGVLRIGGNTVWGEYFAGRIDEVRIYNHALAIGEIQSDMAKPVNGAATADATAPTVSITSPTATSPYATTATTISLGGTASDNVGVTQVAWANDRGGAGTASGTASWTASGVALQPGTNNITVSARDAANNVATKMLTVTVSTASPVAAALSITTQPSASAASGTAFAQQPVVQLRDATNATVAQGGVVVTAAIASGTGTLGGTRTATTNASGVATFTNLSITGAGASTIAFSAPGLTGATSSTITVAAPTTTVSTGEPAFNAATNSMVYQDNMDSYTDVVSMGAVSPSTPRIVPRPSPVTTSQPVRTDDMQLITSGRSGKAIRMVYNGTVQNGPTFLTMNMPVTPDLATHYFQYYARVTPSSPFTNHLAHKWFLAYHRKNAAGRAEWDTHDHLPCTVDNRLTYWHFYDNGVETTCQGQQPIGPDFNNNIADGQWHRFTYEYRPNTSVGSRDGVARMWIDGVKMMDVSQAAVGVIPPGGEKAWCAQDDVDNIAVNDGIFNQFWGSVQTSYTSPVWTLDIDDFSWWIKP